MRQVRTPSAVRSAAVLAVAALCLHQLVYLLAFSSHSGSTLDGGGHAYLAVLAPVIAALAVSGIAATILATARRARGAAPTRPRSWASWTLLLLIIFVTQEAGEALVRTGSLDHLLALAQTSGTATALIAVALGRLVGLALSGLTALDAALACPVRRRRPRPVSDLRPRHAHCPAHPPRLALAFGFSRRPPPVLSA